MMLLIVGNLYLEPEGKSRNSSTRTRAVRKEDSSVCAEQVTITCSAVPAVFAPRFALFWKMTSRSQCRYCHINKIKVKDKTDLETKKKLNKTKKPTRVLSTVKMRQFPEATSTLHTLSFISFYSQSFKLSFIAFVFQP